jgi:hypothetical protein
LDMFWFFKPCTTMSSWISLKLIRIKSDYKFIHSFICFLHFYVYNVFIDTRTWNWWFITPVLLNLKFVNKLLPSFACDLLYFRSCFIFQHLTRGNQYFGTWKCKNISNIYSIVSSSYICYTESIFGAISRFKRHNIFLQVITN